VAAVSGHWDRPDRPRCKATSTRTGEQCQAYPVRGAQVCAAHGGRAPQVRAAARRRLEVEKVTSDVRAVLAHHGVAPIGDPFTELGKLTAEVISFKDALAARVNSLEAIRDSAPGTGSEQLRAELGLLERSQDRAGKLLGLLVSSNFEERRTRLSEQQGQVAGLAIKRILDAMLDRVLSVLDDGEEQRQLSEQWQRWVVEVVPPILRSMRDQPPPAIAGRVVP
jgi:hypothetical protein